MRSSRSDCSHGGGWGGWKRSIITYIVYIYTYIYNYTHIYIYYNIGLPWVKDGVAWNLMVAAFALLCHAAKGTARVSFTKDRKAKASIKTSSRFRVSGSFIRAYSDVL